jgi:uncharacterized protein (DUF2235 family)
MGKNIIICCDGTNNDFTGDATNVLKLYRSLIKDARQVAYYDPGVGTLSDSRHLVTPRNKLRKLMDSAIGHTLRDNWCKAYKFLSGVYEPGDKIYFFGFSRGAFTARAVAGGVHMLGLARRECENMVPYAWATYSGDDGAAEAKKRFGNAGTFRAMFSRPECVDRPGEPLIHFLGVWDTVSSLGWIWNYQTMPYTASNPSLAIARHAVAIDERRACFRHNLLTPATLKAGGAQDCKEVWFAGVHCDIGGGYASDDSGLAKIPLEWMFREAEAAGLLVDPDMKTRYLGGRKDESKPDPVGTLHASLTPLWWALELMPRRTYNYEARKKKWRLPNFWKRRTLPEDRVSSIHRSVETRKSAKPEYRPKNLDGKQTQYVA